MASSTQSLWNSENVKDVAESVGLSALPEDILDELARDVDYRVAQVLEEALKFMRHGKRTTMTTQDVSNALKVLNVEPLYGYESTRPLRFGEASVGRGQTLYYVEDEEVDFEKMINQSLPKVPREITFTAHWLAVEGVQPTIPQNPTATNHADLLPKGPNANPHLAAANGLDNVNVKPLVKHVLSKESQELFAKLSSALIDETNSEWQNAALASIRSDPGIHQLTTYLITFIAEKVTHCMKNLFILRQMMLATSSLMQNQAIYLDPYIAYMVPPVLTCCTGKHLGPSRSQLMGSSASSETFNGSINGNSNRSMEHFGLRDLAASILSQMCKQYSSSNQGLKPRIARTCLKQFMDPNKPLGTHYGALRALEMITGTEGTKMVIIPNLALYNSILKEGLADETKKPEAEQVLALLIKILDRAAHEQTPLRTNGVADLGAKRDDLVEKVGDVVADKLVDTGRSPVAQLILDSDLAL